MAIILYDNKKIEAVLKNFYELTEIPTCLYDSDFSTVAFYGGSPEYCKNIRKDKVRDEKCFYPDKCASMLCIKQNRFITYTCHAGISETVAPIFCDNIVVGYLLFGGIKDKEKKYTNKSTIKDACNKYNLDFNEYIKYYDKLKTIDEKTMIACTEILQICIKYIINEKYVKIDDSVFSAKVIEYLNNNFAEDITFEQLCQKFYVGKNYLYKVLKSKTGQTVNNYLIKVRMKNAKKYLEQTDLTITEISAKVGFYDYNYFIRIFKKYFNITPLQYRKKFNSKGSND